VPELERVLEQVPELERVQVPERVLEPGLERVLELHRQLLIRSKVSPS